MTKKMSTKVIKKSKTFVSQEGKKHQMPWSHSTDFMMDDLSVYYLNYKVSILKIQSQPIDTTRL